MVTEYGLKKKLEKEELQKKEAEASICFEALTKENAELKKENTALKQELKEIKEASDDGKGTDSKNSSRGAGASKAK